MAKKKFDLRQKPAPPVQETVVAPVNQLPFPTGEKLKLTPEEVSFLEAAGWKDGDPIPDLKKFLSQVEAEQAQVVSKLETSGIRPTEPQMVNFEDLPEKKQKELTDAFEELRTAQQASAEQPQVSETVSPGVAEAIAVATQDNSVEVVDDPAQAAPNVDIDPLGVVQRPDPNCSHCGWDISIKETVHITEKDKQTFLASILGGTRFYKDINLFGDTVTVRYRTLTTVEADLALRQCAFDYRDDKLPDQGEFFRVHSNYRLALSIARVSMAVAIHVVPTIDEIEWDEPAEGEDKQTALPVLEKWLHENVLANESMRRVIGIEHQRFQRLVEKLEARVDDSDFWKGAGPKH